MVGENGKKIIESNSLFNTFYRCFKVDVYPIFENFIRDKSFFNKSDFKVFWKANIDSKYDYNPLMDKVFDNLMSDGSIMTVKSGYLLKSSTIISDFVNLIEKIISDYREDSEDDLIEKDGWMCRIFSITELHNAVKNKSKSNPEYMVFSKNFNMLISLAKHSDTAEYLHFERDTIYYGIYKVARND